MVWKRIGSILRFAYDDGKCFVLDSTGYAVGEHVKFLTALFNSKMGHYLLKESPRTGTGDLLISVQALAPIHVPNPPKVIEESVCEIVDRIIDLKRNGQGKSTSSEEAEIDRLIYKLYNLTSEEIAVVEGTTAKKSKGDGGTISRGKGKVRQAANLDDAPGEGCVEEEYEELD